jgi:hypothetical protein
MTFRNLFSRFGVVVVVALGAWFLYGTYVGAGDMALSAPKGLNPCAAKTLNPCAAKTLNPCAAKTLNPCAAKTLNPCAAKTLNPCAAKTLNPCAAKTLNPCAAKTLNPCAARTLNPCAAKTLNPCAAKTLNPSLARTLNPCAAKTLNPCAAKGAGAALAGAAKKVAMQNPCNPCGARRVEGAMIREPAGFRLASGAPSDLLSEGEKLWNDRFLGKSGLACSNCHIDRYTQMNATFAKPYPHTVAMPAQQASVDPVTAAEMVQFCMVVPMMSEPLPWASRKLAALTSYVEHIQKDFDPKPSRVPATNPCAGKLNPCGSKGYH